MAWKVAGDGVVWWTDEQAVLDVYMDVPQAACEAAGRARRDTDLWRRQHRTRWQWLRESAGAAAPAPPQPEAKQGMEVWRCLVEAEQVQHVRRPLAEVKLAEAA